MNLLQLTLVRPCTVTILKNDGTLWACGYNSKGQLGDGTNTNRSRPVQIMDNVQNIAAGGSHSLILKNSGTCFRSLCLCFVNLKLF
ncbi:MAG: hypothetical protein GX267_01355 [Fibrobacter sp.]|nr:hypothetical protein [Fibrobacter sp.]